MSRIAFVSAVLLAAAASPAQAQSFCASDGQPQPVALLERFTSADCEVCWSDGNTPQPRPRELALDWIVPSSRGDDALLSAAASRESLDRLHALGRAVPKQMDMARLLVAKPARSLRVAHGLPFNGYMAASIALQPGSGGPWSAWLLVVETIPAGAEGTPIERNLIRNVLQPAWGGRKQLLKTEQKKLLEWRPMSIPPGANPDRLRVVGWVQDGRGRVVAAAQSRCVDR